MSRIVIEDLAPLEQLTPEELVEIFGAGRANRPRLGVEGLEERQLMATSLLSSVVVPPDMVLPYKATYSALNKVLQIQGTSGADTIRILQNGQTVSLDGNTIQTMTFKPGSLLPVFGRVNSLDASQISRIEIDGKAGDDLISLSVDPSKEVKINSIIFGGLGNDKITGGGGADVIHGDDGNDTILGMGGIDDLFGEAGADYINGGNANDNLYGGIGDDILIGGEGVDTLDGSTGTNTLIQEATKAENDLAANKVFSSFNGISMVCDSGPQVGKEMLKVYVSGPQGLRAGENDYSIATQGTLMLDGITEGTELTGFYFSNPQVTTSGGISFDFSATSTPVVGIDRIKFGFVWTGKVTVVGNIVTYTGNVQVLEYSVRLNQILGSIIYSVSARKTVTN